MNSEVWNSYFFSEFVQINPPVKLNNSREYSFVEMKDLNSNLKYVYPSTTRKPSSGSRFQNSDTLFARITPCLENGKICQVNGLEDGVGFGSTEFLVFRGKEGVSDTDFIYYLSRFEKVRKFAESNLIGTSGRQRVTWEAFDNLQLTIPDLPTQRRIAEILAALDDKIELNRQTNATLEAVAQAIFKEWFVDFNYPGATGEMVESELGLIPKGWHVGLLGEISETIDCLHSKKPERQNDNTGYLLLQLWNILDSGHLDTSNPYWISEKDYKKWITRIEAVEGISVITNVGRVGVSARIPAAVRSALGRNMTAISVKHDFPYDVYLILLLKSETMAQEIENKTDPGTIMDSLNVRNVPLLRFVHPPVEVVNSFERVVKPLWVKADENIHESAMVAEIRDALLPKLMNGEIAL